MWDFSFTLPSLLVLIIFLGYYLFRPRLPFRINRVFLTLLLSDVLTILFDYLSSRADEDYLQYPVAVVYALNTAYFAVFLFRIMCFAQFTIEVLNTQKKLPAWILRLSPVVFIVSELIALSSPLTHAFFFIDQDGYHRGPLYDTLYVCFFFYLAFCLVLLFLYQKRISTFELCSLFACHMILLAGNIARMLFPQYLVMNMFCLLAIIVLFLSFQNPDLFLSDRGNAYNTRAFRILLGDWLGKKQYRLVGIIIRDYDGLRSLCGGRQMDRAISEISSFLSTQFREAHVFYLRNGCFALVCNQMQFSDRDTAFQMISERFRQPWTTDLEKEGKLLLDAAFSYMDSEMKVDSVEKLILVLRLSLEKACRESVYAEGEYLPDMVENVTYQVEVKQVLDKALEKDQIEVYYQPLIESDTGKIVAAEALARMHDADGTMISPEIFIPIAEQDGRIEQLGEQVLQKVCILLSEHDLKSDGITWINVNLSPRQCIRQNLAERFRGILDNYKIPVDMIHLEITEQMIVDNNQVSRQIQSLLDDGFLFALDDYGSGFSNFSRVRKYPFSQIKIDREVVWEYFKDRDPLLPAIVQTYRQMGYSIVAEGIESREMSNELSRIGCNYLQGFYYSKPVPADDFLKLISGSAN